MVNLVFMPFAMTPLTTVSLVASFALGIMLFRRWCRRSPYEHIPGPPRSSMIGTMRPPGPTLSESLIATPPGYLLDLHNPDGLGWHFQMTEKYGHVARLRGGVIGVSALLIRWIRSRVRLPRNLVGRVVRYGPRRATCDPGS